jgi:hypothetical protein
MKSSRERSVTGLKCGGTKGTGRRKYAPDGVRDSQTVKKKVVFMVLVEWSVGEGSNFDEVYAMLKGLVPEGTGLYVGCNDVWDGGVQCDAVLVLRGKLATVGDLVEWFEQVWDGEEDLKFVERGNGQAVEQFLEQVQGYSGRAGITRGEGIKAERGDAETVAMVERQRARMEEGEDESKDEILKRMNAGMRWHQMTLDERAASWKSSRAGPVKGEMKII